MSKMEEFVQCCKCSDQRSVTIILIILGDKQTPLGQCLFYFQMSNTFLPSRKRPGESTSEHPMDTDDSGDTATEHENGKKKEMKKSDSNEELGVESEKSKVIFIKFNLLYC